MTVAMMTPFIMGAAIGIIIMGKYPLGSLVLGTFLFYAFQTDCFQSWKKQHIEKFWGDSTPPHMQTDWRPHRDRQ